MCFLQSCSLLKSYFRKRGPSPSFIFIFQLTGCYPNFFCFTDPSCLLDGRLCKYFLREHDHARFFTPWLNFRFLEIKVDILEHNIVTENRYPLFQTSKLMQLLCLSTMKSCWTTVCCSFQQKYLLLLCAWRRKIKKAFRSLMKHYCWGDLEREAEE